MTIYDEVRKTARVTSGLYLDVGEQLVQFFEERNLTVVTYREIMQHFVYGPSGTLTKEEFKSQAKKLLESFTDGRHWHYALPGVDHVPPRDDIRGRRNRDVLRTNLDRFYAQECNRDWEKFKGIILPMLKEIKAGREVS